MHNFLMPRLFPARLYIIFDALSVIKTPAYFARYFATIRAIDQNPSYTPLSLLVIKLGYAYKVLMYLLFYLVPFTEWQRIYLFDYFHLTNVTPDINPVSATLFFSVYILVHHFYFLSARSDFTQLIYQVVCRHNSGLFLQQNYRGKNVINYLTGKLTKSSTSLGSCILVEVFSVLSTCFIVYQILLSNFAHYFLSLSGLLELISFLSNALFYCILLLTYQSVFQLAIIFPFNNALITFLRLKQADGYLEKILNESQQKNIRISVFSRLPLFYRFHAQIRASVVSQNSVFSEQIFSMLLVYGPASAYLVFLLLLGRLNRVNSIIFGVCIYAQLLYIFGVHLIAVKYPPRIHRAAGLLWKIHLKFSTMVALGDRLKLVHAYFMLYTRKPYGITYGKTRLITMGTFTRFIYFYVKFMIFSYKINNKAA